MTPESLKSVQAAIAVATREDINAIISALKTRQGIIQRRESAKFHVGQTVRVNGNKRGSKFIGTVEKVNPKTVKVRNPKTNVLWTVSPSLITANKLAA